MKRREGRMTPGPETSMEHHCLIREPWLHLPRVSLGGTDSMALLWDIPTATVTPTGSPD